MDIRVDGRGRYRRFGAGDQTLAAGWADQDSGASMQRVRRVRALALAETSAAFLSGRAAVQPSFDALARRLAERVDGGCVIRPLLGAEEIPVAADHVQPYRRALLAALMRTSPHALGSAYSAWVGNQGRPILTGEVAPRALRRWTDPAGWAYLDAGDIFSFLVVPVWAVERVVGTLAVWRERPGRALHEDDRALAEEIGRRLVGARQRTG